jgi:hypothetical protein
VLARESNQQLKVPERPLCRPVIHLTNQATEKVPDLIAGASQVSANRQWFGRLRARPGGEPSGATQPRMM